MRISEYDDGYESAYWFERADEDGPDDAEPDDDGIDREDEPFDTEGDEQDGGGIDRYDEPVDY